MKSATLLLLTFAVRASEAETCSALDSAVCPGPVLVEPLGPVARPSGDHLLLQVAAQAEKGHRLALQHERGERSVSRGPSAAMQEVLDQHNLYRCMHDVPLMQWSDAIASNAQSWANQLGPLVQAGQPLQHSSQGSRSNIGGYSIVGENLAMGTTPKRAIDLFYDEIEFTNGGWVSSFSVQTGHYTQVVWRESVALGCAVVNGDVLVCQYGPTGNMGGQFNDQVNGPVRSRGECQRGGGSSPSPTPSPTPSPMPSPMPSPGGCQDTASFRDAQWGGSCSDWRGWVAQGYPCQDYPSVVDSLRQNCPNACGFGCDAAAATTTTALTTTTSTASTTREQTGGSGDACSDDASYTDPEFGASCSVWEAWVAQGYRCEDAAIGSELVARCPRACGTCSAAGSPSPSPQGCSDSNSFVDAQWGGTCQQWQIWVTQGYRCQSYPAIKDDLEANCPQACGVSCP